MNNILYYFLLFLTYSVIGYIFECAYCTIRNKRLILNRGFLVGPYLPIYGSGAVLMVLFLSRYTRNAFVVFIMGALMATIIEYITSFVMELFFKARWWDYSKEKYNINGRVCLLNTTLFGIGGVVMMYLINPVVLMALDNINRTLLTIAGLVGIIIFAFDIFVSTSTIYKLRSSSIKINKELPGEISTQLHTKLRKNKYFKKRLLNAFPNIKNIKVYNKINEIIQSKNI